LESNATSPTLAKHSQSRPSSTPTVKLTCGRAAIATSPAGSRVACDDRSVAAHDERSTETMANTLRIIDSPLDLDREKQLRSDLKLIRFHNQSENKRTI
jgi:hypothetical protein